MPREEFKKNITDLLPKISFFGGIPRDEVIFFIERLEEKKYKVDEKVFVEGGKPGDLYILIEGDITLTMEGNKLLTISPGTIFGVASPIGIQKQLATATATKDSTLAVIPKKVLYRLEKEKPELFSKIILNVARDLARALKILKDLLLEK